MAYTITNVIELASKRTERRAENELDLRGEFWQMLGEFILERRYPWRKKTFTFNTKVGTQLYDVSAAGADPTYASLATDLLEIITAYRIDASTSLSELVPLLTEDLQNATLEATTSKKPSGYLIQPGTTQTIMLDSPADAIYKIRMNYWAAPDPVLDSSLETIPLVPPQLHWGLVIALERNILRYLYGQGDPRTVLAEKRYDDFLKKAARFSRFTTNAALAWNVQDRAIIAVDATTSGLDSQIISRSD